MSIIGKVLAILNVLAVIGANTASHRAGLMSCASLPISNSEAVSPRACAVGSADRNAAVAAPTCNSPTSRRRGGRCNGVRSRASSRRSRRALT